MDTGKIIVKNSEGKEMECDVLFTFNSDETKKSYIVYTDNTKDDLGNTKVYANTWNIHPIIAPITQANLVLAINFSAIETVINTIRALIKNVGTIYCMYPLNKSHNAAPNPAAKAPFFFPKIIADIITIESPICI